MIHQTFERYDSPSFINSRSKVFTVEGDDRPDVQDVLIVFTDGRARDQEDARFYAQNLKNRDVHIMGIAAGPDRLNFKHQLDEIASSPDDVLMVEFDDLDGIINKLVNKVCKQPPSKYICYKRGLEIAFIIIVIMIKITGRCR